MQAALKSKTVIALVSASLVVTSVAGLIKVYFSRKNKAKRKAYPRNVVILHQFPNNREKPSFSMFCLKVETWLRVNDVKYQNEFSMFDMSAKGQLPYITLNDLDISDSYFIIQYLTEKYGKDLNDHLTTVQKAIGRAFFRLVEDGLKWPLTVHRFRALKLAVAQGSGRHAQEEIYEIARTDLKAMEDYLNEKKYFMGDLISMVDIEVFSLTAQITFYDRGEINKYFKEKCPNLMRHFRLIMDEFWPEWKMEHTNL